MSPFLRGSDLLQRLPTLPPTGANHPLLLPIITRNHSLSLAGTRGGCKNSKGIRDESEELSLSTSQRSGSLSSQDIRPADSSFTVSMPLPPARFGRAETT